MTSAGQRNHINGQFNINAFLFERKDLVSLGAFLNMSADSASKNYLKILAFQIKFEETLSFDQYLRFCLGFFVEFELADVENLFMNFYASKYLAEQSIEVKAREIYLLLPIFIRA